MTRTATLAAAALLALAAAPALAEVLPNGMRMNGLELNGIRTNGMRLNGADRDATTAVPSRLQGLELPDGRRLAARD